MAANESVYEDAEDDETLCVVEGRGEVYNKQENQPGRNLLTHQSTHERQPVSSSSERKKRKNEENAEGHNKKREPLRY